VAIDAPLGWPTGFVAAMATNAEANAIGNAYLQAEYLPEAEAGEV